MTLVNRDAKFTMVDWNTIAARALTSEDNRRCVDSESERLEVNRPGRRLEIAISRIQCWLEGWKIKWSRIWMCLTRLGCGKRGSWCLNNGKFFVDMFQPRCVFDQVTLCQFFNWFSLSTFQCVYSKGSKIFWTFRKSAAGPRACSMQEGRLMLRLGRLAAQLTLWE